MAPKFMAAALATVCVATAGLVGPAPSHAIRSALTYVDCPADARPTGVRCAELTVPLDWRTPDDGRTITVALRVVPAESGSKALTFNPGGPGGSGIEAGQKIYRSLPSEIRRSHDFVMWDPRGVGASGPGLTGCPRSPSPAAPDTGPVDWEAAWTEYANAQARANRACFEANPQAAPFLGTWNVVRDLEAMRSALGYPRWDYWGMSYGTRIGYTYAKTFPRSIDSMVLDGSLWPKESIYRIAGQQPAGWFTAQQVYASVMGHAKARKISQILEALDEREVQLDGITYTRWMAFSIVFGSMGSQDSYPRVQTLVKGLHRALFPSSAHTPASSATNRAYRALRDRARQDASSGYATTFVHCADLHDRPSTQSAVQLARNAAANYGTSFGFATMFALTCAGLPPDYSPALPRGGAPPQLSTPPMMVISTGDLRTPWVWGRTMGNAFEGSRTVSYTGTQHVTYLRTPSKCVNRTVTRYLLTRHLPRTDISCPFAPA